MPASLGFTKPDVPTRLRTRFYLCAAHVPGGRHMTAQHGTRRTEGTGPAGAAPGATPRSRSDFSGGSAWESNPKPLNKRNQATTHANSSFRPSEQRVDRRLDLFARPRHYPQMRLSFGDSLETSFDDDP